MKPLTKSRAVVYLIAVFLLGGTAGGVGGYCYGLRKAFTPPGRGEIVARMTEFARSKLQLTDEQVKQITPIINDTAAEFAAMHTGMADRVNEIVQKARQRITPFLTPEQKVLLDDLERQRREQFRKMLKSDSEEK